MIRRVLHLIDTTGPGGAETVFVDLASEIQARGYSSLAVVAGEGWVAQTLRARGLEPLIVPSQGAFDFRYLTRLVGIIRSRKIDVVQAHLFTSSVYGSVAARLCGIPSICTFHGQPDLGSKSRWLSLKFRLLNWAATRVVFVSETLRASFLAVTDFRPAASVVVHNGIDPSAFANAADASVRTELGVRDDEFLILSVGNIRPAKSYDVLLQAARRLVDAGIPCRFVVVGHPKQRLLDELLALRSKLGVDQCVEFLGFRADVARLLSAADLFLLTSKTEGFSLATVQAMAAGLPVVVTRSGGPEEIVQDGVSGRLVDIGDDRGIANAIVELRADPALARRLAAAGAATVRERFALRSMLDGYDRLYQDSTQGATRSAAPPAN